MPHNKHWSHVHKPSCSAPISNNELPAENIDPHLIEYLGGWSTPVLFSRRPIMSGGTFFTCYDLLASFLASGKAAFLEHVVQSYIRCCRLLRMQRLCLTPLPPYKH